MRLLFITQKVDKDDDFLGVYHHWIEELSKKMEKISIICLQRGKVELPANTRVFSLGKETGESRWKYLKNLFTYLWRLRKDYDNVFIHMNPEYAALAGWWWRLTGKKIFLWYNHPLGGFKARIAIAFSRMVFHTSPQAFASRYQKAKRMPVGIDMNFFRPLPEIKKKKNSLLYIGRISPIKNLKTLIEAAGILDKQGVDFSLAILGDASKPSEHDYVKKIKLLAAPLANRGKIRFFPSVPNYQAPEIYNQYEISVNLTPSGSFDKTIIEAMACGIISVASNKAVVEILPADLWDQLMFQERDSKNLADKLEALLRLDYGKRSVIADQMRHLAVQKHSLKALIKKLSAAFDD